MRRRAVLALSALIPAAATLADGTAARAAAAYPDVIDLPDGFAPEGIAIDGGYAYLASRRNGDLYRADLATGAGEVIYTGPGTPSDGLKIDCRGRAFVAGGTGGDIQVVDVRTGALLAGYRLTEAGVSMINDVVLVPGAAWFTDSRNAALYKLPIAADGTLATTVEALPLTGLTITAGVVNLNGITATPDGRALLVVQTNTGGLFRVDPATGAATPVDLGDATVINGDGLLLEGRTLYVVQNRTNALEVFTLNRAGTAGTLVTTVTTDAFTVPTTLASFRDHLYIVNGKLTTTIADDVPYNVIALPKP
ncbi:superoxide dismutase [Actinoplanes sp. NPDC051851]|uniref:SMP-30/gluconolactonase/LRE family protein n=1 Tax=Actinoplanes sp. NPDC051851 TaxID=3154753 RepID=UPI003416DBCA